MNISYSLDYPGSPITTLLTHQKNLKNNHDENKFCDTIICQLTTSLHENQFTTIGFNQTPDKFIAPKANQFYIQHYDNIIARYIEDSRATVIPTLTLN